MLDGEGAGVFATRTPHRPNPIGLSLAMIETVDAAKGVVHLRGVDVIEVGHFVSAASLSCCLFLVHSRALARSPEFGWCAGNTNSRYQTILSV